MPNIELMKAAQADWEQKAAFYERLYDDTGSQKMLDQFTTCSQLALSMHKAITDLENAQ